MDFFEKLPFLATVAQTKVGLLMSYQTYLSSNYTLIALIIQKRQMSLIQQICNW